MDGGSSKPNGGKSRRYFIIFIIVLQWQQEICDSVLTLHNVILTGRRNADSARKFLTMAFSQDFGETRIHQFQG